MPLQLKDWTNGTQPIESDTSPAGNFIPAVAVRNFPLAAVDAFSRLRVSLPGYRFDSQFTNRIDPDLWDTKVTTGSVTHSATERWVALTATASSINSAVLQSHYHAPYTPGRGQLCFITFNLGAHPASGGYKRVGYYDGTNGIYLERTATATNLVLKSSTSKGTETIPQASWNLDPMDGTGPSGITLDLSRMQILVLALQALYVGRATVGFDIGGELIPVHQFLCANEESFPYIAQASLPVRYEVGGTAATGTDTVMHAVCASVISEGGADIANIPGRNYTSKGEFANLASAVVCAIRVKAQLNSINQNAVIIPTDVTVSIADAGAWISVLLNPEITAGTFTDVHTSSVVEESFAGNAGTDPTVHATNRGTIIDRFYVPAAANTKTEKTTGIAGKAVLAYSHLLASGDVIAILVEGGATTDAFGSLKWKEIR
jgi:hypothetical protein